MKLQTRLAVFYAAWTALSLVAFGVVGYAVEVAAEALEDEAEEEKAAELAEFRARMLVVMGGALPVAALIAFMGARWMTFRTFRVVENVVATAQALELDQLNARIPQPSGGGAEVEELVHALNGMLDRLERSTRGLQRFTADAAHELRTPLSVLGARLEAALTTPGTAEQTQAALAETLAGVESLGRIVEALVTLARSDAGQLEMIQGTVDVALLCGRLVEAYQDAAEARDITVTLHAPGNAPLQTDGALLERVVGNLLDNAVKFCRPQGHVRVTVAQDAHHTDVLVSDDGPGLTARDQEHAFTRFYRGEQATTVPGSGLGLSLAREFVRVLGGAMTLANAPAGGVEARVRFLAESRPAHAR